MQFSRDESTGLFIRSFSAGELHIGQRRYRHPVILGLHSEPVAWSPPETENLKLSDLALALAMDPELILLGTGNIQRFPPPRLAAAIMRQGIGFEVMSTRAACRTFNLVASDGRQVAAALIL